MAFINKNYNPGISQRYLFGDNEYNFNNIVIPKNGIALFDSNTGIGGENYFPADGDTVTVVAGYTQNSSLVNVKEFDPALGNTIYYLVTDKKYTVADKDEIISLATPIVVSFFPASGGYGDRYQGGFVFSNPSNYTNLYLIFDYTDVLDSTPFSFIGSFDERIIDIYYGTDKGVASVDYITIDKPVRYKLFWNNVLVADTGYVGLNSLSNYNDLIAAGVDEADINLQTPYDGLVNNGTGTMSFNKYLDYSKATLVLAAPLDLTEFELTKISPTLTSFYIDLANGDDSNVCSQTPQTQYYHDGASALPVLGDRIYIDAVGSALFDGASAYHQISTTPLIVPPVSGGVYVVVDERGVVRSEGSCDCGEVAIPVVTAQGYVFTTNQDVNVALQATNNPFLWSIATTADDYEITGGDTGTIFDITDLVYGAKTVTMNIGESTVISSTTAPVIVGGTGTSTIVGPSVSTVLPNGISFNTLTGELTGVAADECEFSFDVTASNCVGASLPVTITITITQSNVFVPFLIDIENFGTNSAGACSLTAPLYSVLYHNGPNDTPDIGDIVARTMNGSQSNVELFFGGCMWYKVYNSSKVIKICETGKVCDSFAC